MGRGYKKWQPGLASDFAMRDVTQKKSQEEKNQKGLSEDSKNRQKLVSKVNELIESGMSLEEAIDLVIQDANIMKAFEYWKNNHVDVRECIKNLVNYKNKNKSNNRDNGR